MDCFAALAMTGGGFFVIARIAVTRQSMARSLFVNQGLPRFANVMKLSGYD
jgi:hypothetical protein